MTSSRESPDGLRSMDEMNASSADGCSLTSGTPNTCRSIWTSRFLWVRFSPFSKAGAYVRTWSSAFRKSTIWGCHGGINPRNHRKKREYEISGRRTYYRLGYPGREYSYRKRFDLPSIAEKGEEYLNYRKQSAEY